MANWILAIDEDARRLEDFRARASTNVAPLPGLQVGARAGTNWALAWAAADRGPVDVHAQPDGTTVRWGEPRDEQGALQTAAQIHTAWRGGRGSQWDGFYSAITLDAAAREVTVGTDVLGIFPVYYWSNGKGLALVATSAELLLSHPGFAAALDMAGLVGVLLSNGLTGGRTLWSGVNRLAPGRRLRIIAGRVGEQDSYHFPDEPESGDLPLEGHVELLADTLGAAVRRHMPSGRNYGLLLSGGLDSRMVAGFMMRAQVKPRAMTVGVPSDLDMRCASAVARRYGLEHRGAEPEANDFVDYAQLHSRWEHLANGFNTLRDWWTQGQVTELGECLAIGGLADSIIGGTSLSWAYSASPATMSGENFFRNMPRLGLSREVIEDLLAKDADRDLAKDVEQQLKNEFDAYAERKSRCAWRYDLAHGQRYHVGSTAWRLSFGSWPVLPVLDRAVIKAASILPASSLAHRAVQLEMVRTKLPELADLPLDRSDLMATEPQYLSPRARHVVAGAIRRRMRAIKGSLRLSTFSGESRYWYRVNNFEGHAWKAVRGGIADHLDALQGILNVDKLRNILPPPGQHTYRSTTPGPWIGESGRKLLLGLAYWSRDHH